MTPQSELELRGSLLTHPFADLVAEIAQSRLSGSLRLSNGDKKSVIYFKNGRIVFAVSNARSSRLFAILLSRGKLSEPDLRKIPDFVNDIALAANLESNGLFTKAETHEFFVDQIETLFTDILTWDAGEWTFSSLARIRDGLEFNINIGGLLIEYGRCIPTNAMLGRFRSLGETFSRSDVREMGFALNPEEAFVLSRSVEGELTAANIISVSSLSESAALHAIYNLWLGGLLTRIGWQSAFSANAVSHMKNAHLELRKEATLPLGSENVSSPERAQKPVIANAPDPVKEPRVEITIEEYLERVENAGTYYDLLGVESKADFDELKQAYFALARKFHPDRFHAEGGEMLRRVQAAFTELAQAHETLKNQESRDVYDYRMRKELAERERNLTAGNFDRHSLQIEQAAENFDRGFALLMDKHFVEATPFLARAVHFAPNNARYHAYYGKALSADDKQRHKAEAEMQKALQLDSSNPTFRILLAEFFIQHNLLKRAEGELKRLLAVFPSNGDAREMLEGLHNR